MSNHVTITPGTLLRSMSFYPVTLMYIAAVASTAFVSCGALTAAEGVGVLALAAVVVLWLSTRRELTQVHALMVNTCATLQARIDELENLLRVADEVHARPPPGEQVRHGHAYG